MNLYVAFYTVVLIVAVIVMVARAKANIDRLRSDNRLEGKDGKARRSGNSTYVHQREHPAVAAGRRWAQEERERGQR